VRDALRQWEQSRASGRQVWFDGRVVRCAAGVLALWNPNREVVVLCPEPCVGVQEAVLAAFLEQAQARSPQEAAAFLDAHWEALRGVSIRDSEDRGSSFG